MEYDVRVGEGADADASAGGELHGGQQAAGGRGRGRGRRGGEGDEDDDKWAETIKNGESLGFEGGTWEAARFDRRTRSRTSGRTRRALARGARSQALRPLIGPPSGSPADGRSAY